MILAAPRFVRDLNKFKNDAIHSKKSTFEICDLKKYKGCTIQLDLVKCEGNSQHEYVKLKILESKYGFVENQSGGLVSKIEDFFGDTLRLDFVTFEKREKKRFMKSSNPEESRDMMNGRIRVQIFNEFPIDIVSDIIRFLPPNVNIELNIEAVGFPATMSDLTEQLLVITFKQSIMLYPDELYLCSEYEQIRPYHYENIESPTNFIVFNLSQFSRNCETLRIQCPLFAVETKIEGMDRIRKVYPQFYRQSQEVEFTTPTMETRNQSYGSVPALETSAFRKAFRMNATSSATHLKEPAKLIRIRYSSEVTKKNKTSFPYNIENMSCFHGMKMTLDLIKWKEDELHPSMKLYMRKPHSNFQCHEDYIDVLISNSIGQTLSLDCLGIEVHKKMAKGEDVHNCRLRMQVNDFSENSNVIRHLDTRLTEDIYITSVGFPLPSDGRQKLISITFNKDVPYYLEEFSLISDEEEIFYKDLRSNTRHWHTIVFDLADFSQTPRSLRLHCKIFDLAWQIDTGNLQKVYGSPIDDSTTAFALPESVLLERNEENIPVQESHIYDLNSELSPNIYDIDGYDEETFVRLFKDLDGSQEQMEPITSNNDYMDTTYSCEHWNASQEQSDQISTNIDHFNAPIQYESGFMNSCGIKDSKTTEEQYKSYLDDTYFLNTPVTLDSVFNNSSGIEDQNASQEEPDRRSTNIDYLKTPIQCEFDFVNFTGIEDTIMSQESSLQGHTSSTNFELNSLKIEDLFFSQFRSSSENMDVVMSNEGTFHGATCSFNCDLDSQDNRNIEIEHGGQMEGITATDRREWFHTIDAESVMIPESSINQPLTKVAENVSKKVQIFNTISARINLKRHSNDGIFPQTVDGDSHRRPKRRRNSKRSVEKLPPLGQNLANHPILMPKPKPEQPPNIDTTNFSVFGNRR